MDAKEIKKACNRIVAMYKKDNESAHIEEDEFLQSFIRTLDNQIQALQCDESELANFKETVKVCITHINTLIATTEKKKWYA